jgi:homoserine dehydrogenase
LGDVLFCGKVCSLSDIINLSKSIIRSTASIIPDVVYGSTKKIKIIPAGKGKAPFYLKFSVIDKSGVLSKILIAKSL